MTSATLSPTRGSDTPLARLGRGTVSLLGYAGALVLLPPRALRAGLTGPGSFRALVVGELSWMFGMGLPLVGLSHVGLGSFLSMQSYFGGTFIEGTGAVVGVGLFRNVAPLMSGLVFAGLLGARVTPDFRLRDPGEARATDRLVAARLLAAMVAGSILGLWACVVGTFVGWRVATALIGLSTHTFFHMFSEMVWARDVVGVFIKGALFGLLGASLACHEGLRDPDREGGPGSVPTAACRAVCLAALGIMLINSGWFLALYHVGPTLGPTLLSPPNS